MVALGVIVTVAVSKEKGKGSWGVGRGGIQNCLPVSYIFHIFRAHGHTRAHGCQSEHHAHAQLPFAFISFLNLLINYFSGNLTGGPTM